MGFLKHGMLGHNGLSSLDPSNACTSKIHESVDEHAIPSSLPAFPPAWLKLG